MSSLPTRSARDTLPAPSTRSRGRSSPCARGAVASSWLGVRGSQAGARSSSADDVGYRCSGLTTRARRPLRLDGQQEAFAGGLGFLDRGESAPGFDQTSVKLWAACSRTASTCRRVTPGNHSRNCATVAPSSRFANKAFTGTLVPLKVQAPLSLSGARSTPSHRAQSSMVQM